MADAKPKTDAPAKDAAPATAAASPEAARPKGKGKTIGIVAAVMIVEGAAIFFVMKSLGGHPDPVAAAEGHAASKPAPREDVELQVVNLRALNVKSGRPVLYGIKVYVRVDSTKADDLKTVLEKKKATLEDAVARIVRSADPSHLSEDGLETLRRQIQFELGRISQDESCIEEILIPECTPYPTGF